MCKTYSYFSVFLAENQRFAGSDRDAVRACDRAESNAGERQSEMQRQLTLTAQELNLHMVQQVHE